MGGKGGFLAQAGDEAAQRVLLDWASQQYRAGSASLSELAAETGLALEAIARHVSSLGAAEATELFLTSSRTLAETFGRPDFYASAQKAVRLVQEEELLSSVWS